MRYWKHKKILGTPRVGIGVASFLNADARRWESLRCLVDSFCAQTYPNWKLRVVHDGPAYHDSHSLRQADRLSDEGRDRRITFDETAERKQQFGHPWRQYALDMLATECEWLLLTNDDNYYMPVFLEWLLSVATTSRGCKMAYCDMIHSHRKWTPLKTAPKAGSLDLGGFIVHRDLAKHVPFDNFAFNGDGDWINRLVEKAGASAVQKVPAVLFVHN